MVDVAREYMDNSSQTVDKFGRKTPLRSTTTLFPRLHPQVDNRVVQRGQVPALEDSCSLRGIDHSFISNRAIKYNKESAITTVTIGLQSSCSVDITKYCFVSANMTHMVLLMYFSLGPIHANSRSFARSRAFIVHPSHIS